MDDDDKCFWVSRISAANLPDDVSDEEWAAIKAAKIENTRYADETSARAACRALRAQGLPAQWSGRREENGAWRLVWGID